MEDEDIENYLDTLEVSSDNDFSADEDEYLLDDDDDESSSSDSESSKSDSDIENIPPKRIRVGENITSSDNDWSEIKQDPPQFPFKGVPFMNVPENCVTPGDYFDLFLTESFLTYLVEQTNLYANQEISKAPLLRSSRLKNWKDTSNEELRVFFGLLLHMGPITLPSISHYWNTSKLYGLKFFQNRMSRNRFQMLLRFLHFSNNEHQTTDRLFKIKPILQHFNDTMDHIYHPKQDLCIDESMVLWRGRLIFRQYIKNKRHKYGIKLFELCESKGMILRVKIYEGKQVGGCKNHASEVVMSLMEGFLDKGYNLYMDNFYNSVGLTKTLTNRSTYVCGTLRANRKENPKNVIQKKLKKGESTWARLDSVVVCKWKDKRDVLTISNKHYGNMVEVMNRNKKISIKPDIVRDYTLGMAGVDRSDQNISYYSSLRKSVRWYKKLGFQFFEMFMHNAWLLYTQNNSSNKKLSILQFREKAIEHLAGEPKNIDARIETRDSFHYLESIPPTEKKNNPTKPCRVCYKENKRCETRYICAECPEKPALCVNNCFKIYHKN